MPLSGTEDLNLTIQDMRELCSFQKYQSGDDMVEDTLIGGPCRRFVLWFLSLSNRDNRSQKVSKHLVENWPKRGGRNGTRWVSTFARSLWTCFSSMRTWSVGILRHISCAITMVDRRLKNLSRFEAALVAGTGLVLPHKENVSEAAMEFAQAVSTGIGSYPLHGVVHRQL